MSDNQSHDDGRKAQEQAGERGSWRDNPHRPGSRDYYDYEDGRRAAGARDVGPAPGTPAWG